MGFNHTISAILRGHWFIHRGWAESHLPLILSILQGTGNFASVERTGSRSEGPFAVDPTSMERVEIYKYDFRTGRMVINAAIPQNSVAVMPISGAITKYNGQCGEPGALTMASQLEQIKRMESISSVIMLMDTPGGEVRAAHALTSAIKNIGKPILSYVDGMSASLGMWITAATQETYLSNDMDEMGSIGSYCMLADLSGQLEMKGIKLHEIYAPQSTDKNKKYNDAFAGDYTAIQEDLKITTDAFIQFVKNNRGEKAAANMDAWNTGKMFYAREAIQLGLADGIRPFAQVVSKAAWLSKRKK
jgi:protease-4